MAAAMIPSAKAIYLCEEVDVEGGMTNLYALFNAIRPKHYPHTQGSFVCFAQLVGGLGDVPFYFDIRRAEDDRLIRNTNIRVLHFPDRTSQRQVVVNVEGCVFDKPGVYLVELYCDNTWVATRSSAWRSPTVTNDTPRKPRKRTRRTLAPLTASWSGSPSRLLPGRGISASRAEGAPFAKSIAPA